MPSISLSIPWSSYIPHAPTLPQVEFLNLQCREALYGGAAGGGKSDALLMAALQYVNVPGYSAIIFRRTFQDLALAGALIPRSQEWLAGTDARWDGTTKSWTFPCGSKLGFGYLDAALDHYRYQGAEYQFVGFDELTQFEEPKYLYLFSRLRAVQGINVPLRMRSASNPGGVGHAWVKRRFVNPKTRPDGTAFVPARVRDNPHLRIDEYVDALGYLDPITRARYLEGDWDVTDDNRLVYPMFDRGLHVVEPPSYDPNYYRCIFAGCDPGLRDPYAVGIWGIDWDGFIWGLDEFYKTGGTATEFAPQFREFQSRYKCRAWFTDKRRPSDIYDLQKSGIPALANLDIHAENERDTIRPMIGVVLDLLRAGRIHIAPSMRWHAQEFEAYQYKNADEKNAGEVPVDKDNHAMDEMRYAICSVVEGGIPGVKLWYNRGEKQPREKRPGEAVRIPTAQEIMQVVEDRDIKRVLEGGDKGEDWSPAR